MATDIDICNLALDNLGITNKITALSQQTKEAMACSRWYATIRDTVLAAYPWPFTTRYADLEEAEGEENPAWDGVWTLPDDFLVARRIVVQDRPNPPPFDVISNAAGTAKVLVTDEPSVTLEYTARMAEALFPAAVVEAMSWRLAAALVIPLAVDPGKDKVMQAMQMYSLLVSQAFAVDLNGRQFNLPSESETITARG